MFEAGKYYIVTVDDAYTTISKEKRTPGLGLRLVAENGDEIFHTIWVTAGTKDNVKKMFEKAFELDPEVVHSRDFWSDPVVVLKGKKVQIKTKEEEYNGKARVIVDYINPVPSREVATPDLFLDVFAEKQQTLGLEEDGTTPFD
jgi:hypothetical protein